jgi:hypothetical protein
VEIIFTKPPLISKSVLGSTILVSLMPTYSTFLVSLSQSPIYFPYLVDWGLEFYMDLRGLGECRGFTI